ncbi:MAG TPA: hypothetical protein VLA71_10405 [Algoriphagus sp.]|jgi:hypothetical protein|nr:hypothetical protein [Algoriphagus sp.]
MKSSKAFGFLASVLLFGLALIQPLSAQDKDLDIKIDLSPEPVWYEQTWLIVAGGAAIFILILVAILKNNGKKTG